MRGCLQLARNSDRAQPWPPKIHSYYSASTVPARVGPFLDPTFLTLR